MSPFTNSVGEDCETMEPVLVDSGRASEHFANAIRVTQLGGVYLLA